MPKAKTKKTTKKKAKTAKTKSLPLALVTFLLDRSWSMNRIKSQTLEGFNAYLSGLQEETQADIRFTLLQFDSLGVEKFYVGESVAKVPNLDDETFKPRGGTPLIDSAYETIQAVEALVAAAERKPRVVICIQTDGEENESRAHTWAELSALVKRKQEDGWQFNFIGAGIDAYTQGRQMGIDAVHTMSYTMGFAETKAAFAASASNTALYASNRLRSTGYTKSQKLASGDKFDPNRKQKLNLKETT